METKAFNKITKEVFQNYGFVKEGKIFVLYLKDITIAIKLVSWRGVKYFRYAFDIKALNNSMPPERIFALEAACFGEIKMIHNPTLDGYLQHEIAYEKMSEDYYRDLITKTLHMTFDRYKDNSSKHIDNIYWTIDFSKEANSFLNIPWMVDFYKIVIHYTKRFLEETTKVYTKDEKISRPYRPEEIAWEWLDFKEIVKCAIERNLISLRDGVISLSICNNFYDALRNKSDVFSYDAMLNSNFWKKQRALNTKVAEGLGII